MQWWYDLIGLLPFSWAAPDELLFMKNALLAVLVITPLFGLLSTMVVQNRMAFFSDALGHSGFAGIAIGALAGAVQPMWCAVALAVVFALAFSFVRAKANISGDTAIGVFSSTAVALGIFIATLQGRSFTKFNRYLIGDILSVTGGELLGLALTLLGVLALWFLCYNAMAASSVHATLAGSRGIPVFFFNTLFSVAIAVVVTAAMSWVGLLVINSMLVLPAAAARNLAHNLRQYHILSVAGAMGAGLLGLFASYYLGSSTGAAISLFLALWFAITFAISKIHKK